MITFDNLIGTRVDAKDGEIGEVEDVLFDDRNWLVRYIVLDIGRWLMPHRVLISPHALGRREQDRIPVKLSREAVKQSLPAENKLTVSEKQDQLLSSYYGSPIYWWGGVYPGGWGVATPALRFPRADDPQARTREDLQQKEVHLRSFKTIKGYHLAALDDRFGHLQDLRADESEWGIRYLDIDTHNFLPSKHVLLTPDAVDDIDWSDKQIQVRLSKEEILAAPEA